MQALLERCNGLDNGLADLARREKKCMQRLLEDVTVVPD
jgi:hypothetical protein